MKTAGKVKGKTSKKRKEARGYIEHATLLPGPIGRALAEAAQAMADLASAPQEEDALSCCAVELLQASGSDVPTLLRRLLWLGGVL